MYYSINQKGVIMKTTNQAIIDFIKLNLSDLDNDFCQAYINRLVESGKDLDANKRFIINHTRKAHSKHFKEVPEIIHIHIKWSKQGHPTLVASYFVGGISHEVKARAGGYGYCKTSTVLGGALDTILAPILWKKRNEFKEEDARPYGLSWYNGYYRPHLNNGGIGVDSVIDGCKAIGYNLAKTSFTKNTDSYICHLITK